LRLLAGMLPEIVDAYERNGCHFAAIRLARAGDDRIFELGISATSHAALRRTTMFHRCFDGAGAGLMGRRTIEKQASAKWVGRGVACGFAQTAAGNGRTQFLPFRPTISEPIVSPVFSRKQEKPPPKRWPGRE
jgi:hypothetical protein